jgi:hypothetical protein
MPDAIPNGNFSPYLAQAFTPPGLGWQHLAQFGQPGFGQPYPPQMSPFGATYQQPFGGLQAMQQSTLGQRYIQPPVYIDVVQAADLLARILPLVAMLHWQNQQTAQQWQQQPYWPQQLSPQGIYGGQFGQGQLGPFGGQGDGIARILPFLMQPGLAGTGLGMGYRA